MKEEISLTCLPLEKKAIVKKLLASKETRRRLQDIGIIEYSIIECVAQGPFKDPNAYLIKGAIIALRNEDSDLIIVELDS